METWNGFRMIRFKFEDRDAILVFPNASRDGNPWLLKMEYWDAFPLFECQMVEQGYHLAFVSNKHRWCDDEDLALKKRFCDYISDTFSLSKRCIPVGMSCGGLFAVKFTAFYPQYVAALYLDAPVLNLLSCPADLGIGESGLFPEFALATKMTMSELICYRAHPIDYLHQLLDYRIPVALICGASDTVVPYSENGIILEMYYRKHNLPLFVVLKKNCGHHPHGLADPTAVCSFLSQFF